MLKQAKFILIVNRSIHALFTASYANAAYAATPLHHPTAVAPSSVTGAAQLIAAPTQPTALSLPGAYQGLVAGYPSSAATVAAAYAAAAAGNPLHHHQSTLASTPTPSVAAHFTAQLQQQAADRL